MFSSIYNIADEIRAADCNSTDNTLSILKDFNVNVIETTAGFSECSRMLIKKSMNRWHFFISSDEYISPGLYNWLSDFDDSNKDGFYVRLVNIVDSKIIRFPVDRRIRFSRKNNPMGWRDHNVHEGYIPSFNMGYIKHPIIHNLHGIDESIDKIRRYSSLRCIDYCEKKLKKPSRSSFLLTPTKLFFYYYFGKLGFLGGRWGFYYCFQKSFHELLAIMRYYDTKDGVLNDASRQNI